MLDVTAGTLENVAESMKSSSELVIFTNKRGREIYLLAKIGA